MSLASLVKLPLGCGLVRKVSGDIQRDNFCIAIKGLQQGGEVAWYPKG